MECTPQGLQVPGKVKRLWSRPTGTCGASCLRPPRVLNAEGEDGRGRSPLQHPLRGLPREAGDTQAQNNGGAEARRRGAEFSCRGPGEDQECSAEPLPYQAGRQEDGQAERAAWATPQPPSPLQLLQACPWGALAVITRAAPGLHPRPTRPALAGLPVCPEDGAAPPWELKHREAGSEASLPRPHPCATEAGRPTCVPTQLGHGQLVTLASS